MNGQSQPQPSRPYLFYSPKCPHCQQLIDMIKRDQNLAMLIEPVNIHTAKSLPPQLEGVPAILVNNKLLVGPDTFKWVQMTISTRQNMAREADNNGGGGDRQNFNQQDPTAPMPSIGSDTKYGIDFMTLPNQQMSMAESTTMSRFSYLSESGGPQANGTDGIDTMAAMGDGKNNRAEGVAQQLEYLQKMREADSRNMRNY